MEIIRHRLLLGQLVAFTSYLSYLFGPAERLLTLSSTVQSGLVGLERLFSLLDTPAESPSQVVAARGCTLTVEAPVRFHKVSFYYPGQRRALTDVDFEIERGETVVVIGRSGAGKTTILRLLLGFLEAQEGSILLNGRNILEYDKRLLRSRIGFVPQESVLFSGTIAENIRYGKPRASQAEVAEATRLAHAHEFIAALPRGYDTSVGEGGAGLSVGQKQRICIARAMLKDPHILVFDEPTSAVDNGSDQLIHRSLQDLGGRASSRVIALPRWRSRIECLWLTRVSYGSAQLRWGAAY
jgi:ABC-type multidrug transport system fused ATPase/permease subunit